MVVHSLTIFDRKGKTIFTKTFSQAALKQQQILQQSGPTTDPGGTDAVTEQRKLVFGMLFSLREIIGSLSPEDTLPCKFLWMLVVSNMLFILYRNGLIHFIDSITFR
jgi:hypothetical protein